MISVFSFGVSGGGLLESSPGILAPLLLLVCHHGRAVRERGEAEAMVQADDCQWHNPARLAGAEEPDGCRSIAWIRKHVRPR